jgi:hypothetical protein
MLVSSLAYSLTLKIEATCSYGTSSDFQRSTGRHILEDGTLRICNFSQLYIRVYIYRRFYQIVNFYDYGSRDSAVGIASVYGVYGQGIRVRGLLPRGKAAGA